MDPSFWPKRWLLMTLVRGFNLVTCEPAELSDVHLQAKQYEFLEPFGIVEHGLAGLVGYATLPINS